MLRAYGFSPLEAQTPELNQQTATPIQLESLQDECSPASFFTKVFTLHGISAIP